MCLRISFILKNYFLKLCVDVTYSHPYRIQEEAFMKTRS